MTRAKWILIAIPLALMLVMIIPTSDVVEDAAPDNVYYLDENSDTQHFVDAESVLNAVGNTLTAGYWYASGIISLAPLTINGNVVLILTDNCQLSVTGAGTTTVPAGSSLTVYPQSRGAAMGKLVSTIVISGGSLKNVANIEYNTRTVDITSGGPVVNYGLIKGTYTGTPYGTAIYSTVAVSITNGHTDVCEGTLTGTRDVIYTVGGSTVENSGRIELVGSMTSSSCIAVLGSNATVTNYQTGNIVSIGSAVTFGGAGSANNTFRNFGYVYGLGGVSATDSTIINESTGYIEATSPGAYAVLCSGNSSVVRNYGTLTSQYTAVTIGGGSVDNHGKIYGLIGIYTSSTPIITNYDLIECFYTGVYFNTSSLNGAVLNNYGTIDSTDDGRAGTAYGVFFNGSTNSSTLNNYGTINAYSSGGGTAIRGNMSTIYNDAGCLIQGNTTGMFLNGRSNVTNNGTITGGTEAIRCSNATSALTLVNNKIINGNIVPVNAANDFTFKAGSVINGNINLGTNVNNLRFTGTPDSSLTYATVTGTVANINSMTTVYIDGAALPPLSPGAILTLINIHNTGAVSGTPLNPTGTFGGYTFQILVQSNDLIAKLVTINFAISASDTDTGLPLGPSDPFTFSSAIAGYGGQTPLDVTVKNIGSNATGDLSVALSGTDAASFTISRTAINSIGVAPASDYDRFTVVPNTGLLPGTYTAIVTIERAATNANPVASISFEISFTVDKSNSSTVLSSDIAPSFFGQTVTFTATVSAVAPGTGTPTGNVVFVVDGVPTAPVALNASGIATYSVSTLSVGSHFIVANYQGDSSFNTSSDGMSHIVVEIGTATSLASNLNPSTFGQMVTFTATVTVLPPGTGTPTGSVTFFNNGVPIGTSTLNASGVATLSISTLSVGRHPITAVYGGDATYDGSTSADLEQVVIDSTTPGDTYFIITAIADSGSTITPSGRVSVKAGSNQTFFFSAKDGFTIVEVWIDGHIALSQAQIDLGWYTFTNVMADHTIEVKTVGGLKRDLTLTIEVMEGEGYAEYNLNGAGFVRYTGVVIFTAGSSIAVRAFAADGYIFDRWEIPAVVTVSSLSFNDVRASLYLELYFAVDDTGKIDTAGLILWITALLLLLLTFLILFFLIWYRTGLYLTITMGEAVKGAAVTYRIERNGRITNDIKLSNSRGKLRIAAKKDSVVTISMAAKDGYIAIGMPLIVVMENRREYRDIILK